MPEAGIQVHTRELAERISWIIRLRWVAAGGVAVTAWWVPRLFGIALAQRPLYLITTGLACYNVALWVLVRWVPNLSQGSALHWLANAQIGADLVFLTALLHFSGGIENPFVSYYVFHIVIASILLSRRATYFQTTFALGLLFATGVLHAAGILPHYHLIGLTEQELYRRPVYVFAVLFVVATMLSFTAFMATSITARLRQREAEILGLSRSLSQRAADLERTYESLRRVEREKSEYMHRVAHDLRSPLATVERMLAVVCEGRTGQVPEKAHSILERVRERVRHLMDLARDLLVLSQAREAPPTLSAGVVDLRAILAGSVDGFRKSAQSASISFGASLPANAAHVSGDPESLSELMDNLISNAIKYTPPAGNIRMTLFQQGGQIEIRVTDSGIGIPADEQDLVFTEFYRASNARESKKEGTGLGLSIIKAIADRHRGKVSVESRVGCGSTFRVLLPLACPQGDPQPHTDHGEAGSAWGNTSRVSDTDDHTPAACRRGEL